MKGLLNKARNQVQELMNEHQSSSSPHPPPPIPSNKPTHYQHNTTQGDQTSSICEPTALDIIRYRYHHGTNLGSIYVLEKWLHRSMFPSNASSSQSSELEALKLWTSQIGLEAARAKFESHWAKAVSDDDIDWLANVAKCTTIRLPIGYFTLLPAMSPPPPNIQSDPFYPYLSIYTNAWSSIQKLIYRLQSKNIGVLLDLHALPGGANGGDHSGTNSKAAALWTSNSNLSLGTASCQFLASEIARGLPGISGIQVVNEAGWDSPNMYSWYDSCISAISSIDPSIPVYISDGWNLSRGLDYIAKKNIVNPAQPTAPVLVDTHLYWAFTDADKAKTPQQIISEASSKLSPLDGKEGSVHNCGAVELVVGEYSCVLTEDSWAKSGGTPKADLVRQFGQAQSQRYQARAGGSFFWTWKMDWMPGGEWGFAAQTNNGAITAPQCAVFTDVPARLDNANSQHDALMRQAVEQHVGYWNRTAPGGNFEHGRYEDGWKVGFRDAASFFGKGGVGGNGGCKIGCTELWVLKRIRESGMSGGFVWEFEQGLRKGMDDFYAVVGC